MKKILVRILQFQYGRKLKRSNSGNPQFVVTIPGGITIMQWSKGHNQNKATLTTFPTALPSLSHIHSLPPCLPPPPCINALRFSGMWNKILRVCYTGLRFQVRWKYLIAICLYYTGRALYWNVCLNTLIHSTHERWLCSLYSTTKESS